MPRHPSGISSGHNKALEGSVGVRGLEKPFSKSLLVCIFGSICSLNSIQIPESLEVLVSTVQLGGEVLRSVVGTKQRWGAEKARIETHRLFSCLAPFRRPTLHICIRFNFQCILGIDAGSDVQVVFLLQAEPIHRF